ncbi:hypothetical protein BDY21DRAFT_353820 [Lineolata rhizophorae]|uniref:Uncharacterized protein n=1 Tax=Lineolata rhizophorae TaxID=578093 RepID=A0A6A6NRG3_9PEZI|nr:hypothetical protein BDY21DRAFT_353820 [Lineolata rhizophorae]
MRFWAAVERLGGVLETVVLAMPEGLLEVDVLDQLARCFSRVPAAADGRAEGGARSSDDAARTLRFLIVNTALEHVMPLRASLWKDVRPDAALQVVQVDVPVSFYGDDSVIDLCQEWIRDKAILGSIWDAKGRVLVRE